MGSLVNFDITKEGNLRISIPNFDKVKALREDANYSTEEDEKTADLFNGLEEFSGENPCAEFCEIVEIMHNDKLDWDNKLAEIIEYQTSNGWTFLTDEQKAQIGALTGSPVLSEDIDIDDQGDVVSIGKAYWYPNHQVMDYLEELLKEGEVIFEGSDEEEETSNVTYSLLVSNVGWVIRDDADKGKVKALYDDYVKRGIYEQVSMWASDDPDPIEMHDDPAGE